MTNDLDSKQYGSGSKSGVGFHILFDSEKGSDFEKLMKDVKSTQPQINSFRDKVQDINLSQVISPHGETLVHWAARIGNVSIMRALVEKHGCNANQNDFRNATPLYMASLTGKEDVVRLLVSYFVDPRSRSSFSGMSAVEITRTDSIKKILMLYLRMFNMRLSAGAHANYAYRVAYHIRDSYVHLVSGGVFSRGYSSYPCLVEVYNKSPLDAAKMCIEADKKYEIYLRLDNVMATSDRCLICVRLTGAKCEICGTNLCTGCYKSTDLNIKQLFEIHINNCIRKFQMR